MYWQIYSVLLRVHLCVISICVWKTSLLRRCELASPEPQPTFMYGSYRNITLWTSQNLLISYVRQWQLSSKTSTTSYMQAIISRFSSAEKDSIVACKHERGRRKVAVIRIDFFRSGCRCGWWMSGLCRRHCTARGQWPRMKFSFE